MKNELFVSLVGRFAAVSVLSGALIGLTSCASSGGGSGEGQHVPGTTEEQIISHEVSPEDIAKAKSRKALASNEAVLYVNGMGCPLCATNINMQLERVRGVTDVKVDLGVGKVTVFMLPNTAHPSPAVLGDAVEDAGFTLVKVEER
ncbi:MAG: heavy-metal-associated domain-containing protein [Phycisphaerales bacterium]